MSLCICGKFHEPVCPASLALSARMAATWRDPRVIAASAATEQAKVAMDGARGGAMKSWLDAEKAWRAAIDVERSVFGAVSDEFKAAAAAAITPGATK